MKTKKQFMATILTVVMAITVLLPNGVVFAAENEHTPELTNVTADETGITLTYGSDANGQISEWMLMGDIDRDGKVTRTDVQMILDIYQFAIDFNTLSPLAKESADFKGKDGSSAGVIDIFDWGKIQDPFLVNAVFPIQEFDFRVIDKPMGFYEVSTITINGSTLTVPQKGKSANTTVNGATYTVFIDNNNVATVTGQSLATNDVQFTHALPDKAGIILTYGSDTNGQISEWMLMGDIDRDGKVTGTDMQMSLDLSRYVIDFNMLSPLAKESADFKGKDGSGAGVISSYDVSMVYRILHDDTIFPMEEVDFRVIDTPDAGFQVTSITVNGSALTVPDKGISADTAVNGAAYTVAISSTGVATVTGQSLATNDVRFTHAEVVIENNEAPVINAEDKTLSVGDKFNPLDDVTASDKEDGDLTLTEANITANDVDTSKAGTYHVTYTVTDHKGKTATKTITVIVKEKTTEETSKPSQTTKPSTLSTPNSKTDAPKTGDVTNLTLFIALFGISASLLLLLVGKRKKQRDL